MKENSLSISSMFSLWNPGVVRIGNIPLGGSYPVRIQSMTNTPTLNTEATVRQCIRMIEAGCELVRITAQNLKEAENLDVIKRELRKAGFLTPLIADVHFNPEVALKAARIVEEVRINPGNYAEKRIMSAVYTDAGYEEELARIALRLLPLLKVCKEYGTAIRIGTNHGSLSGRIRHRYGDSSLGMVESTMEFVRIFNDAGFHNLVLSMKSSNVRVMVEATRLLVHKMITENMMYPVHLGVTEAGNNLEGRIKSAAGIGTLLADGIGDTIRVSLTEEPENEIPVAKQIVSFFPKPKRIEHALTHSLNLSQIPDFEYKRRISSPACNIGNGNAPVVLHELNGIHTIDEYGHIEGNHGNWFADSEPEPGSNLIKFLFIDPMQDQLYLQRLKQLSVNDFVLVLNMTSPESIFRVRSMISELDRIEVKAPVILAYDSAHPELPGFAIDAALRLSPMLNDGLCDGIFLKNSELDPEKVNVIAFGILQATRARITQTEYIACPGCGRTQYKLEEAFEKVKAATSHLKGLKIAVMGCIVNGPGEMADADYGYVGQGSGKVSIYKGKTPLKKNIEEEDAVDVLISVIEAHGQWVSP